MTDFAAPEALRAEQDAHAWAVRRLEESGGYYDPDDDMGPGHREHTPRGTNKPPPQIPEAYQMALPLDFDKGEDMSMNIMGSRFVQLASREFLADNEDCNDRKEILLRAKNYAETHTSSLPVNASRVIVAAFLERVRELHREIPKRVAAKKNATTVPDFPAEMFYLT